MAELKTLIDRKPLVYEGIFRMDEMWAIINRFIKSRGYVIVETRNEEKLTDDGKDIFIEIEPYRKVSDYFRKIVTLEIYVRKLKDKTVKVDGKNQKYHYGEIEIRFTAQLMTDWRNRWEGTGFYFLMRVLLDRFVRYDVIREIENETVKDCLDMQEEIRAYLNMTRFKMLGPEVLEGRIREGVD
jgi:hypothetical protein